MQKVMDLPVFVRGSARVALAFKSTFAGNRRGFRKYSGLSAWQDSLLNYDRQLECADRLTLASLGYEHSPHPKIPVDQITACHRILGLFSNEAVHMLRAICADLESHAGNSDWIISRRTRGLTDLSSFINDMMNSRAFLLAISRIAGVPLVPYPMINARSQVNYFYPTAHEGDDAQRGMWHTDGTNYVMNILLSDSTEYTGGDFLYFKGTRSEFDRNSLNTDQVVSARLDRPGDALFIYGSRLFHGVRPVTAGKRMSLVLSFHCPYTQEDSNTFWHLASDDGVPATVKNWLKLKKSLRANAVQQYEALNVQPISFDEISASAPSNATAY